jgi:tellurite resistance protein
VPPALIYANGMLLFPGSVFLENLFFASLILAVSLLFVSRNFLRWPFGAPWWAFTFPLDALAYAAARYAQDHPSTLWRTVCATTLLLATLAVTLVLVRTLAALAAAPRE